MPQDLAPKGGYPSIRYARNVPNSVISAGLVGIGMTLMSFWGGYRMSQQWVERRYPELQSSPPVKDPSLTVTFYNRRELKREKLWARLYILPLVQAEMDREWVKWRNEQFDKEAEVMKDVPDWVVGQSVYHNDRWAFPAYDINGNPVSMLSFYLLLFYSFVTYLNIMYVFRTSRYPMGRHRGTFVKYALLIDKRLAK